MHADCQNVFKILPERQFGLAKIMRPNNNYCLAIKNARGFAADTLVNIEIFVMRAN